MKGIPIFDDYLAVATEAAQLILANARRAAELIQGFKQVAVDQTTSERRRFNLKSYIEGLMISLSPRLRQAGHQVVIVCPDDLTIDSYPGAISQILTNLVMNSITHGFASGDAGVLLVKVRDIDPEYIELTYSDDGRGIATEHRLKIFEPFFTTRRGEGGTGLGLHIVYRIVTKILRGGITLESPDKGTAFSLRLPRAPGIALAEEVEGGCRSGSDTTAVATSWVER